MGWVCCPYRSLADDKLPVYIPGAGTRIGKALELYETEHIKMKCGSDHPAVTEALRLVLFIVQWAKWCLHKLGSLTELFSDIDLS